MIFVLFEVTIKEKHMADYLAVAADLKDTLGSANGFIRSERFFSLADKKKTAQPFCLGKREIS